MRRRRRHRPRRSDRTHNGQRTGTRQTACWHVEIYEQYAVELDGRETAPDEAPFEARDSLRFTPS